MTLRRTTNTNGSNANPLAFKPQGNATDRYCVKCKTWMPSKGGKQLPATKLWVCAAHSQPKSQAAPQPEAA